MYTANAIMPHVTSSPEYNNRIVYQGNQLENSSPSLGNGYQDSSSMGYYNYPTANVQQSYPGEYHQPTNNGVHMSVGDQRCNTVDDRASNNFLNLSTSRNPFSNASSSSHEYYSLQNMDNREAYACQHSVSQGQVNARRICRSPSAESSAVRKTRSWTDAVFASMDREAESILELVSEDAMELERIAATIKQDCKSPNSADALLSNDFGPISLPSVGVMSDLSYPRWSRPQYCDPNPRRKRSPRSDQAYAPEDYVLSTDFQTFSLDSPPGQDYRYSDLYGLPNPVGHFSSNPNLGAYVRNNYPHQQSYLSDLQTYHGASPYTPYRQNYGSDNIRIGSEVMLSEAPRSYFKSCSKDRSGRTRSKQSDSHEDLKLLPDGTTSRAENSKKHKSEAKNRMCIGEDFKSLLGKRKAEQTEDHEVQLKKQKFYFEREEHYVVHKLLRELSVVNIPSDLPRTTSASLFYRLLSSKAEPRVMQTVGGSTTSSRQRKVIVRDDVSEEQIVKYSHVGSHPFVYKHGAASRASPTKSLKLIELLTAKSPKPEDLSKENKENKEGTGNAEEKVPENLENDSQKEAEVVNDAIR